MYKYEELLKSILNNGIKIYGISEWLKFKPETGILIRHDVDRFPEFVVLLAEFENSLNIRSTYYFRIVNHVFRPNIIRKVADLGHEIGYHYEDLSLANGNLFKTKELFNKHLCKLREIAEIKTCAMHGRALSKYDNRDIWNTYNLEDFGLESEAFLSIDYSDTYYFTDTGRSWAENSANLRDKVKTNKIANVKTTDELIEFIKSKPNEKIALVVHTERWPISYMGYLKSSMMDGIVNIVKKVIKFIKH